MSEKRTLELTEEEWEKLRKLLDDAGDYLRTVGETTVDDEAIELADGCDHWLEIVETL